MNNSYNNTSVQMRKGRPLIEADFLRRLDQQKSTGMDVEASRNITKINSNYLEAVDSGFQWVGIGTTFVITIFIILVCYSEFLLEDWIFNLVFAVPSFVILALIIWLEWFRWTYYPVRLNRKNRMVYKFSTKGTVLSVPWDHVFFKRFASATKNNSSTTFIMGLILDEERQNVVEAFTMGSQVESDQELLAQWEFFRRYMEDGPEAVIDKVHYCVPVENKRESYLQGLNRLLAHFSGIFWWIMLPFCLCVSIGRWIAMRTCRVPKWTKEVEDACIIESGDPYVKDSQTNPPK